MDLLKTKETKMSKKKKPSKAYLLFGTAWSMIVLCAITLTIILAAGASAKLFAVLFGLTISTGGMVGGTAIFAILYFIIALCGASVLCDKAKKYGYIKEPKK